MHGERTVFNGRVAIKPYYYCKNGYLHVRYNIDDCVKLSSSEETRLQKEIKERPSYKQDIMAKEYNLQLTMLQKPVLDGIYVADENARKGK